MLEMTERARRRLEEYMSDARRSLAGEPGLDAAEVLRGLREHVDSELGAARPARGPVTAAEMDGVLERLGAPESLIEAAGAGSKSRPAATWTALAALGLLLVGALLVAGGTALPAAFVLVAAGLLLGRLATGGRVAGRAKDAPGRLLRLVLVASTAALVTALLVAPAVLVWSQAQIGGVLDAARNPGAPPIPGTRAPSYWVYVAGVGALATGVWWLLAGAAAAWWTAAVRRAVGPFPLRLEARHGRVLAATGLGLAAAGLLVVLL